MEDKEKKKGAGGRPTDYGDELFAKALDYLDNWKSIGDVVPQLVGLSIHCGICEQTRIRWCGEEDKAEFNELCARVKAEQERVLVNLGLVKATDSGLTKLMLMKHGYSDKQEIDHTTKGESITRPRLIIGTPPEE